MPLPAHPDTHAHTQAHVQGDGAQPGMPLSPPPYHRHWPARRPWVQVPAPFLSPAQPCSGFLFPVAGSDLKHLGSETSAADQATARCSQAHLSPLGPPQSHPLPPRALWYLGQSPSSVTFSLHAFGPPYTLSPTARCSYINSENLDTRERQVLGALPRGGVGSPSLHLSLFN